MPEQDTPLVLPTLIQAKPADLVYRDSWLKEWDSDPNSKQFGVPGRDPDVIFVRGQMALRISFAGSIRSWGFGLFREMPHPPHPFILTPAEVFWTEVG